MSSHNHHKSVIAVLMVLTRVLNILTYYILTEDISGINYTTRTNIRGMKV